MKRIIICGDGAWNVRDQLDKDTGKRHPTNVTKVARAVLVRARDGIDQVVYYHDGLGTAGTSGRLADAVVQVAESLHLDTIAEGIEQAEQQAALVARGCRLGQGYHFGRPVPAAELRRFGIGPAVSGVLAA